MKPYVSTAQLLDTDKGWQLYIRWHEHGGFLRWRTLPLPMPDHTIKPAKPRKPKQ